MPPHIHDVLTSDCAPHPTSWQVSGTLLPFLKNVSKRHFPDNVNDMNFRTFSNKTLSFCFPRSMRAKGNTWSYTSLTHAHTYVRMEWFEISKKQRCHFWGHIGNCPRMCPVQQQMAEGRTLSILLRHIQGRGVFFSVSHELLWCNRHTSNDTQVQ